MLLFQDAVIFYVSGRVKYISGFFVVQSVKVYIMSVIERTGCFRRRFITNGLQCQQLVSCPA